MQTRGFIAVTTSLILMSVTVAILMSAGATTYFARLDAAGADTLAHADSIAESCVQKVIATFSAAHDQASEYGEFTPSSSIEISGAECTQWSNRKTGYINAGGEFDEEATGALPGNVFTAMSFTFSVEKNGYITYEAIIRLARKEVPESYGGVVSLKRR